MRTPRQSPWKRLSPIVMIAAATCAGATPAFALQLGEAPDDGVSSPWRVLAALLLCLVLAIAAAVLMKNSGASFNLTPWVQSRRRLKLIESVRLTPLTSLSIVACDDCELLVLASEKGAEIIERLPSAGALKVATKLT